MKRLWSDYGLSIVLGVLWLGWWAVYAYTLAIEPGPMEWRRFWEGTAENNTSEYLQLFSFVVLTSFLLHRGSHESKDSSDRLEAKVDELLRRTEHGTNP